MSAVRTLTPAEFPAYRAHLTRLGPEDRRLRFGGAVSDDAIAAAVRRLNPATTRLIAAFDEHLGVVAAVQVTRIGWSTVECAFSVEPAWRRTGLGALLMRRAVLAARNTGVARMRVHCLRENVPMRRLARGAGLILEADAGEVDGDVALAAPSLLSCLHEVAAESLGAAACAGLATGRAMRWTVPLAQAA